MLDRLFDLRDRALHRVLAAHRAMRDALLKRVAIAEFADGIGQARGEFLHQRVMHDHPLGRGADLAIVHHAAGNRGRDHVIQPGVIQHDEGVGAAELHRALLERTSGLAGHGASRPLASRQRDAADFTATDQLLGLIVADEQVGVGTFRSTGLVKQGLESKRALRDAGRVLHQHDVACHQVGAATRASW
jgi:hypothetical protein